MNVQYTAEQNTRKDWITNFANEHLFSKADKWDKDQRIPDEILLKLAEVGLLSQTIPIENGGRGIDAITLGIELEEISRASASLSSILTVHAMCSHAVDRFAEADIRASILPKMVSGELMGAFALSEPGIGSDALNVETKAIKKGDHYILNGVKTWISFSQRADIFVVFAKLDGHSTAFLADRTTPGIQIEPIQGMLGFRSAMMGKITLREVIIPANRLLGVFAHVGNSCLDLGRYYIAWTSIGIAQASLNAALAYSKKRVQFDRSIRGHQLIMEMIADMITEIKASRALACHAGSLRDERDPRSIMQTTTAKYFASRMASRAANDAVQIHGANGCSDTYPVQRYFRDARITEIIEGSNQLQQLMIAKNGYVENRKAMKHLL